MNDVIFSNSFVFNRCERSKYSYTDCTKGSCKHYFAYMHKGTAKIVSDKTTIYIKEGDVFYIPNKCSYKSYWYGEDAIIFDSLGFKYMPNFDENGFVLQSISSTKEEIDLIEKLVLRKPIDYEAVADFYRLVSLLAPKMKKDEKSYAEHVIKTIKKEIYFDCHAKISHIARKCNISESVIYATFKKYANITPNEFRQKVLIEKANEILITTDKSIEEISQALQFSSSSYFRKIFKKYTGTTPKAVRKKTIL